MERGDSGYGRGVDGIGLGITTKVSGKRSDPLHRLVRVILHRPQKNALHVFFSCNHSQCMYNHNQEDGQTQTRRKT